MNHVQSECFDHVAVPVFALEIDSAGIPRYSMWNSAAELENDVPRHNVIGKTARDVFATPHNETEYQRHLAVVRSGSPLTYEARSPCGKISAWRRTTLKPQSDLAGSIQRIIGTSIDVSAEHQARSLRKNLTPSSKDAERFIALAAHDLRAPMRNISTLAEMLRDDFVDHGDGKTALIDLLEDVADKSGQLLTDILKHAQEVNTAPDPVRFDFDHLCQTLCGVLDPQALHRITWPAMTVFGDKTAFQIVIRNLLDNAIKHGQKPHLSINLDVQQSTSDTICVEVHDDGLGFRNARHSFEETGGLRIGTGYGLLSVKRLIRARGGNIRIKNFENGKGCSIQFDLPGKVLKSNPDMLVSSSNARKTG